MNIFISYCDNDLNLVKQIGDCIKPHANVVYWDQDKVPGEAAWPTIFKWIDDADLVLVVITGSTVKRGFSVGNEVGYAKKHNRPIIPLVGPKVKRDKLGCLGGITDVPIDPANPDKAIEDVKKRILEIERQKETKPPEQEGKQILTIQKKNPATIEKTDQSKEHEKVLCLVVLMVMIMCLVSSE